MKEEPVFEYHADEARIEIELPDNSLKEIKINSGWSFGTGSHETTRICLRALEGLFKTEKIDSVLDIGCGSGILSIATAALGAGEAVGVDIDSSIIEEARINSIKNGLDDKVSFSNLPLTDIYTKFNLITANILLKTILLLLPQISELADNNCIFVASGIRSVEKDEAVRMIEKSGFNLIKVITENEWVALIFKKSS